MTIKSTNKIKLWKVTVNALGWDKPRDLYFESRSDADANAKKYPASDPVRFAGVFNADTANRLLGNEPY